MKSFSHDYVDADSQGGGGSKVGTLACKHSWLGEEIEAEPENHQQHEWEESRLCPTSPDPRLKSLFRTNKCDERFISWVV